MKQKKKEKRTYKLLQLSNSISSVYRKSSGNNNSQFLNLIKNWDRIIGSEYAKILSPLKVSSKDARLIVASDKNFSLESKYIEPMLIDKINSFYGYSAFKKIDFVFKKNNINKPHKEDKISEETENKIEGITCNIKDNDLKSSLEELGKSMAKKGKIK